MVKHLKLMALILVSTIVTLAISAAPHLNLNLVHADTSTPAPPSTGYTLTVTARSLTSVSLSGTSATFSVSPGQTYYYSPTQNITFLSGTQVKITANNPTPSPGMVYNVATFVRWEGDFTTPAPNPLTITMDRNISLVACYNVVHYDLTKSPTPPGRTPTPPPQTPPPGPTASIRPAQYSVATDPATNITATSVTLNGTLTEISPAQGMYADDFFHWYYATSLTSVQNRTAPSLRTGSFVYGNVKPSISLTGLAPNTTYYFQAYAYGKYGEILSFTTLAAEPTPATDGSIKVQLYNQNITATSNQIYPNIQLVNTGSTAIALATVKIRYYYTIDGVKSQNFYCDYSTMGSRNITGTFVAMTTAKTGADTYLEIGFSSGAGSLAAGASITIQARIAKSDWTNYTQTNDYSFNPTATAYVDWTRVTGYISGVLQWGTEP
jgi:hypothetical protein